MNNAPNQQAPAPRDVQHPSNYDKKAFLNFQEIWDILPTEDFKRSGNKSKSTNGPRRNKEQIPVQPQ